MNSVVGQREAHLDKAGSNASGSVGAPTGGHDKLEAALHHAGEAAHDINNLLAVIIANLDLLSEQPTLGDDGRPLADEALAAAMRSSEIVRGLMAAIRQASAPPAPAPAARQPISNPPDAASDSRGKVILAVEDNPRLRAIAVQQLGALGYRVLEAADGPAALMILNTEPVDLLFTDVVMPGGMSGFDLARLVLSRWPAVKALITSGFPELEPSLEGTVASKLRRLAKPYTRDDLAAALGEVLAG